MKQLRIQNKRDEEILLDYTSFKIIRFIESGLVKEMLFYLPNDEHISITTFYNSSKIVHHKPAKTRVLKYKYLAVSANGKTFSHQDNSKTLTEFAESFKSENQPQQQQLSKTAEVMSASFTSQLTKLGIDIKQLSSNQLTKFTDSLERFISNAGNVTAQKNIFNTFVNWLRKS